MQETFSQKQTHLPSYDETITGKLKHAVEPIKAAAQSAYVQIRDAINRSEDTTQRDIHNTATTVEMRPLDFSMTEAGGRPADSSFPSSSIGSSIGSSSAKQSLYPQDPLWAKPDPSLSSASMVPGAAVPGSVAPSSFSHDSSFPSSSISGAAAAAPPVGWDSSVVSSHTTTTTEPGLGDQIQTGAREVAGKLSEGTHYALENIKEGTIYSLDKIAEGAQYLRHKLSG